MERHPYFDLRMHSDEDLEKLIGLPAGISIRARETLHEWPLSCVQRITAADGRRWIYKAQSGPNVEASFYARAKSKLLVQAETLYQADGYSCMLFECLDAPRLCDRPAAEDEAYRLGQTLSEGIGQISGSPPVYLDISSWDKWQAQITGMVENLHGLVATGAFSRVSRELIAGINQTAFSTGVQKVIEGPNGLIHHDLHGDNVFLMPDGPRIIDWQRPIRGPLGLDLATLVESFGYDPRSRLAPGLTQVLGLLRIHWFTACAARWFPPGAETYDRQIVDLAGRHL